jgi:two-component system phosphate regulon sensor histidine kinase PhoR
VSVSAAAPVPVHRGIPKSQLKLTAGLIGIVVVAIGVWGVAAERGLRRVEMERIEISLEAGAALVAEAVRGVSLAEDAMSSIDTLADRAGRASGLRVTILSRGGVVLGDSNVSLERLPTIESHRERPEVRQALAEGLGRDRRRSATVGRELLYVARPVPGGLVRVASDLAALDAAVARLRRELAAAGGLAVVLALGFSWALSWYTLRPLRELRTAASALAEGELDTRVPFGVSDELSAISRSIDQMGEQLRLRLEEVTREKEQLHTVLEGMVEGVLVVDAKGEILIANSRLRDFYETTGDSVGRPLLEGIRDAELEAILTEASEGDDVVSRVVTAGGRTPRSLRVQAVRFPSEGQRVGTVAVLHDVTELMRLEEVRRDFVANASHELRTPLAAIQGFSETLLSNETLGESERRAYLETIDRHARRLANIVRDLLELSTIEGGELVAEPTRIDVGAIAARFVADYAPRARERGLRVELHDPGDAWAWADPNAVDRIFANLVGNAMQYSDSGGAVQIHIEPEAGQLRVRVEDAGIGIPETELGRIFERFYRVDKARSRALGGTGLGLAIVKHLVQSMGGEIYVRSRLGEGSSFTFTLPRQRGDSGR